MESTDAYQKVPTGPRLTRKEGNRLVIVEMIGEGTAGSWGFTVWFEGMCTGGRCGWRWDAEEACRWADEWLRKYPEGE